MPSFFRNPIEAIRARYQSYRDLVGDFERINGNKIASMMDMDAAFFKHGAPADDDCITKGICGAMFLNGYGDFVRIFTAAATQGSIPVFYLPTTLLNTQSKAEFERYYPEENLPEDYIRQVEDDIRQSTQVLFPDVAPETIVVRIGNNRPEHVPCLYVGDFLNMVDQCIDLGWTAAKSAICSDTQSMTEIFNHLRTVPDYSQHFPQRPPRNGKGAGRKDERPRTVPHQAIPGLSGG